MQISVDKKNNEDIVRAISRISLKGIIHPALKLSRINIKNNKIIISSTNLSIGVTVEVPVLVDMEKEFFIETVPFERSISGMLNSPEIIFDFKDNYLELKTKIAKAKIPYQNGEDMPNIPTVSGENMVLPAAIFKKALQITIPGASTTDIKPELASVYVSFKNNSITSVATDAFQLVEFTDTVTTNKDLSFLIPAKEAGDVLKIIENIDGAITGSYTDTLFEIKTNTTTVVVKLTNGLFPDYNAIIPKEEKGGVRLLRNDLESALRFLSQIKSENNQIIFNVNQGNIVLTTKNTSGGDSEFIINSTLTGDAFSGTVLFNHLKTLVSNIPSESIYLSYYGNNKPFIATPGQGTGFKYLMMPIAS